MQKSCGASNHGGLDSEQIVFVCLGSMICSLPRRFYNCFRKLGCGIKKAVKNEFACEK